MFDAAAVFLEQARLHAATLTKVFPGVWFEGEEVNAYDEEEEDSGVEHRLKYVKGSDHVVIWQASPESQTKGCAIYKKQPILFVGSNETIFFKTEGERVGINMYVL